MGGESRVAAADAAVAKPRPAVVRCGLWHENPGAQKREVM